MNGNNIPLITSDNQDDNNIEIPDRTSSSSFGRQSNFPQNRQNSLQDLETLKSMGFNPDMINKVYIFLKPRDIEHAIDLMSEFRGIMQHDFYERRQSRLSNQNCFICGKGKNEHINYEASNNDSNIPVRLEGQNMEGTNLLDDDEYRNRTSVELKQDSNLLLNEPKGMECCLCIEEMTGDDMDSNNLPCGHKCCKNCWFEFIKGEVEQAKVSFIKCFNHECTQKLSEEFILNIIQSNRTLVDKYHKFKKRAEIINNPNKKFCPEPDCTSHIERKEGEDKYVQCQNGHKYCYVCLKHWHGRKKCDEELDKDFQIWKKGKVIKQCPRCKFYTEKNEGCNHMTCAECKYQWCWLCQGKYSENHYRTGKCSGLQFFKKDYLPNDKERNAYLRDHGRQIGFIFDDHDRNDPFLEQFFDKVKNIRWINENGFCSFICITIDFMFFTVAHILIALYREMTQHFTGKKYRGVENFFVLLASIMLWVAFQTFFTSLFIALSILFIFFPPLNPMCNMWSMGIHHNIALEKIFRF